MEVHTTFFQKTQKGNSFYILYFKDNSLWGGGKSPSTQFLTKNGGVVTGQAKDPSLLFVELSLVHLRQLLILMISKKLWFHAYDEQVWQKINYYSHKKELFLVF